VEAIRCNIRLFTRMVVGIKNVVLFQGNTFQLVLITDGVYSFAMFNYPSDGLQWSAPTQRYVSVIRVMVSVQRATIGELWMHARGC